MPGFQEFDLVLFDDFLNLEKFIRAKTPAPLHPDRGNPEFSSVVVTLNVDMWWLLAIIRVKKESVGTNAQWGWHRSRITDLNTDAISYSGPIKNPKSTLINRQSGERGL
jgi:hypothetical protein